MGRILFFTFLAVPILEIGIFIVLGGAIGLWPTLAGVVVTALIGSYLIKVQGLSLLGEIQGMMRAGELPARQIAHGVMLAVAGALLLTPGYLTDSCGFLLLMPAVRDRVYEMIRRRVSVRAGFSPGPGAEFKGGFATGNYGDRGPEDEEETIELDRNNWR